MIAVPDDFHVPLASQALRAGKHVLVEKPLAPTSREGEELRKVVHQTGLKCQVGCMKRHDPGVAWARRFVQEEVGDVLSVSGWYCDTLFRPAMQDAILPPIASSAGSIRPATNPKADKRHYSLVTHAAHLFDNLRYLGGDVMAVTARLASYLPQSLVRISIPYSSAFSLSSVPGKGAIA